MKNYRFILMGPPGVGKGSYAKKITESLNIVHISTGDIFRYNIKNNTELGKKAKEYMDQGLLVPNSLTNDLVADRLLKDDCQEGFLLDGFPRNREQAEFLNGFLVKNKINLKYAINFFADEKIIIARLSGRRTCPKCGNVYHLLNNKPKVENTCKCGTTLTIRKDDEPEVIKNRLKVYNETAKELVKYYKEINLLLDFNANEDVSKLADELIKKISL